MSVWSHFKSRLATMLGPRDSARIEGAITTLRSVPVFQDLSARSLRHLARAVHYRDFKAEEIVYHEGDPGLGVYIVQRGHVELLSEVENGEMVVVRDVREGEFFGSRSLVHEVRRDVTARVVTDSRLLGFFRPDLRMLYRRQPQVGMLVVLAFAAHLVTEHDRLVKRVGELERGFRLGEEIESGQGI